MELHELLDHVHDADTFLMFARALANDRTEATAQEAAASRRTFSFGAGGWENVTIEAFLNAAISWAEDSGFGTKQGLTSSNPWKQFAVFLYCGKIYQ